MTYMFVDSIYIKFSFFSLFSVVVDRKKVKGKSLNIEIHSPMFQSGESVRSKPSYVPALLGPCRDVTPLSLSMAPVFH